jgi:hypothetical protein
MYKITEMLLWMTFSISLLNTTANANPIVVFNGPSQFVVSAWENPSRLYDVVSWNQTVGYSGVNISFQGTGLSSPATGTAYLTTRFGPGTTPADQIASVPFSEIPAVSSLIPLFSGLNLPTGSYYLSIFADSGSQIGWDAADFPANVTLGSGVSFTSLNSVEDGGNLEQNPPYAFYPPASDYVFGLQDELLVNISTAPEPSALCMILACGVIAVAARCAAERLRE